MKIKAFSKKFLFPVLLLIATSFLLISYIPNIYEASLSDKLPSDRIMIWGEHIYTYDYNAYVSKIRQGQEGRFTVSDKYDNNPAQQGVFLQMLYLLTGTVTSVFHISPPLAFHLLRTVLSLVWVITLVWISMFFFKTTVNSFFALILSLFAASFPTFYQFDGSSWWGMYMSWWQEMDVLKRISYLPHYLANYIILTVLTVLLTLYSKTRNKNYFYFLSIILFISFFIHPAGGLTFLLSWLLYQSLSFFYFQKPNMKHAIQIFREGCFLLVAAAIPLFYITHVTAVYPWKSLVEFDTTNPLPFQIKEYVLSLGPVFFTGIAGLLLVFIKKEKKLLAIATWVLAAFLGIAVFTLKPIQSPARFVQTANHVPLALLSVYLVSEISKKINKKIVTIVLYTLLLIIPVIGIIQSYYSLKAQLQFIGQRANATMPLVPYPSQVMYPLKDFYFAMEWLRLYSKPEEVVFSKITAGNYIPAYAGNFVYLGHNPETPHFAIREQNIREFFMFTLPETEAKEFLRKANISYVFYGPQEKEESGGKPPPYSFLKSVYQSGYVTIYKVMY